jgi:hypothetical protein
MAHRSAAATPCGMPRPWHEVAARRLAGRARRARACAGGWSWRGLRRLPWLCRWASAGSAQGGVDTAGENGGQVAGPQVAGVVPAGGSGSPRDAVTFSLLVPVSEAGLPELVHGARVHGGLLPRSCGQLRLDGHHEIPRRRLEGCCDLVKPRPGAQADPLKGMGGGSGPAWRGTAPAGPRGSDTPRPGGPWPGRGPASWGHRGLFHRRPGPVPAQEAAIGSLSPGSRMRSPWSDLRAGQQVLSLGLAGGRSGVLRRGSLRTGHGLLPAAPNLEEVRNGGGINVAYRGNSLAARRTATCTLALSVSGQAAACPGADAGVARSGDRAGGKRTGGFS